MSELVLGESLEVLIDHRGKTPKKLGAEFVETGVPVASAILVTNGVVHLEYARRVSSETYDRWMPIPTQKGDVLLTSEAPLGRVATVPSDEPLVLGQRIFGLRGRRGVLDSKFLYYALQTERVMADLVSRSTGTTVFGIRQSALRRVRIPAPTYAEQRAIAEALGVLDDKIAVNTKLAHSAWSLAEAEFCRIMNAPLNESTVGSVLNLEYGKALPASRRNPGNVDVFGSGGITGSHDQALLTNPGVIVGRKGTVGAVYWAPRPYFPIDTTFYVVPKTDISLIFSYFVLKSLPLGEYNFDSAVPGLNRQKAHAMKIGCPSISTVSEFSQTAMQLVEAASQVERESVALAAARDALLPHLMSGRLRVKDAERAVEEVL